MKNFEELQQAVDYLSVLPINGQATVDLSLSTFGVTIDIHRASAELVTRVVSEKGQPASVFPVPSGNIAVRWEKLELFIAPGIYGDMVAVGVLEK